MSTISCQQSQFGTLTTGQTVTCYSLRNASGMLVNILDYGAILNAVRIPDSKGKMDELTSGFKQLDAYTNCDFYSGKLSASFSSYANYIVPSLGQAIWQAESSAQADAASVKLSFTGVIENSKVISAHKPFTLETTYTLTAANELIIRSQIQLDGPLIPMTISYHPHWNLAGDKQGDILGHVLQVWADQHIITDASGVKTCVSVKDSPFDFLQPQRLGEKLNQLSPPSHYNTAFVLAPKYTGTLKLAACIRHPISGRILEMYTTEPGMRFYTMGEIPNAFCLTPHNLAQNNEVETPYYQQETLYKLIW